MEALGALNPAERVFVLAKVERLLRHPPGRPLDDETAAVVHALDTPEYRIELAREFLEARGTDEYYTSLRIADAILDLNHERSSIARQFLAARLAELKLEVGREAAEAAGLPPDAMHVTMQVEGPRTLRFECWNKKTLEALRIMG